VRPFFFPFNVSACGLLVGGRGLPLTAVGGFSSPPRCRSLIQATWPSLLPPLPDPKVFFPKTAFTVCVPPSPCMYKGFSHSRKCGLSMEKPWPSSQGGSIPPLGSSRFNLTLFLFQQVTLVSPEVRVFSWFNSVVICPFSLWALPALLAPPPQGTFFSPPNHSCAFRTVP